VADDLTGHMALVVPKNVDEPEAVSPEGSTPVMVPCYLDDWKNPLRLAHRETRCRGEEVAQETGG